MNDPLMMRIINELHVNYDDQETTTGGTGQLLSMAKAILGKERLKWLERKGLLGGGMDNKLFQAIAISPMSYPALRVLDNGIETAETYYWRSRVILNEKKILRASRSVGRLHLSLYNGDYVTGFLTDYDTFITTEDALSFFDSREDFIKKARISFTKHPMPLNDDLYKIIEIRGSKKGFLELKMDKVADGEHNILDVAIGGDSIGEGDLLIRIGFPKTPRMDEVSFSDMMVYQLGDKLGKLNITPGVCRRKYKEDVWKYKSAGGSHLGSPIIHLDSGKLIGMDIGHDEFMVMK